MTTQSEPASAGQSAPYRRGISAAYKRVGSLERLDNLTPRERETLAAIAIGMSDKEIAATMCTTVTTVKTRVSIIYNKLGITHSSGNRRVLAALYAMRPGVLG